MAARSQITTPVSMGEHQRIRQFGGDASSSALWIGRSLVHLSVGRTNPKRQIRCERYPDVGPDVILGSTSSLRKVNKDTLEMTCKISSKAYYTQRMELSLDRKTLTLNRIIVDESGRTLRSLSGRKYSGNVSMEAGFLETQETLDS